MSMGPHRKLGIYIGFESPSIIKYLESFTGDLHTAGCAAMTKESDQEIQITTGIWDFMQVNAGS
jgi:hypothetical protein